MVKIHQRAKFQAIWPLRFLRNAWKLQIWPVSLSQNSAKTNHQLSSYGDVQDTSACKISGHSLNAFSGKFPKTFPDRCTDGRTCLKMVMVARVDQRTHVLGKRGYFRLWPTDRRTDKPESIMPPAPKGGGIKICYTHDATSFPVMLRS